MGPEATAARPARRPERTCERCDEYGSWVGSTPRPAALGRVLA